MPTTGATIRVELPSGKVLQLDFLFGLEVRQQRFNLSEFDRVSLSRGFRAGYQVSLVGADMELKVFQGEPGNRVSPRRRSCCGMWTDGQ